MASALAYAGVFVAFLAIFASLKRHPDWSRGHDGRPYTARGWWRPLAIGWFAILALFVLLASVKHGFHWGMLLVFPILGAAFALGVAVLSLMGRRAG